LDKRFIVPEWHGSMEKGRLHKIEEAGGINFSSQNYWPASLDNTEKQIFNRSSPEIPLKVEVLDSPDLHLYGSKTSEELLKSLIQCPDIEMFSHRSIRAIIEQKWRKAKPAITKKLFIPFILYLAYFQLFVEYIIWQDMGGISLPVFILWKRISKGILIAFALYFLVIEMRQFKALGTGYFSMGSLWSVVDFIPLLVSIIAMGMDYAFENDKKAARY